MMKAELFNNEANSIWKRAASISPTELLQVELEFYRKMLIFFQIGESCYFIFNYQTLGLDFASKEVESLLGYTQEEATIDVIMNCIHPEDRAWFLGCQDAAIKFLVSLPPEKHLKYKLRFDCRFRKKNGKYLRMIQQAIVINTDENGGVLKTLIVLTDVTHLKTNGKPILSYIGMEGEPSYHDVDIDKIYTQ